MDLSRVCVILPCYNEAISLEHTVNQIRKISTEIKVLVVNNMSTDETVEVAIKLGLRVVNENIRGKGYAVRKGFTSLEAKTEIIVLVDADDTYDLSKMYEAILLVSESGFDMAVASRMNSKNYLEGRGDVFRVGHKIGNNLFSRLNNILHPAGIIDSLSGFRVFSRNFVNSFSGGASGFEIEAELNAHASIMKMSVANFDVQYVGRRQGSVSKLNTYKDGFRILRMNFKIFRTFRPKLAYTILASFWMLISLSLSASPIKTFFEIGTVPRFPSLIAGVGAFIIAIQLWNTGIILDRIKIVHLSQSRIAYNKQKNDTF
jgi:glycosyltransferase involved in cell wall biosynthesis